MAYTYRLTAFDGLALPIYNPESDMGTGAALTSYSQLPGGGFFDNYGRRRTAQGIRDISYRCWIYNTAAQERRIQLENLRAKIGVLGKLAMEYDDGGLRWQYARLVDVVAPNDVQQTTWLPVTLTFRSAAQYWFGVVWTDTAWTWGDNTWTWSDGTAEFGQGAQTFTVDESPETVTLQYGGTVEANNIKVLMTNNDGTNITAVTVENTTQENNTKVTSSAAIANTESLYLDCGLLQALKLLAAKTISSITQSGNITTVNCTGHGLNDGDNVLVRGTDYNDGYYVNVTRTNANVYTYTNIFGVPETAPTGASSYEASEIYTNLTFTSGERKSKWLTLSYRAVGISNITGNGTTITVDTIQPHNFTAGDTVAIDSTTTFDGEYTIATVTDNNTVTITDATGSGVTETVGTISSGTNTLTITTTTAGTENADFTIEWYDHHA